MATFGNTTFSDGPDEWLQLGNEEWVRPLSMGNNWSHIRIGLLWAVTGSSTIGTSNGFAIGVCSGTTHPFNDPACTNFVGIYNNGGLFFNSNAPNNYWTLTSSMGHGATKVGSTLALTASNMPDSVGMMLPAVGGTNRRGLLYVDIIKGSPNYTIWWEQYTNSGSNPTVDFTVANLKSGLTQTVGSITVAGVIFNDGNGAQTIACSESPGIFDTIDIYSNFAGNPMQIYEVAIQKIS